MEFQVERRYLNLPVQESASLRRVRLLHNGREVRAFDIHLAVEGVPDYWVVSELDAFRGQRLAVEADGLGADAPVWATLVQADEIVGAGDLYHERCRPQFHFSARRGWHNDPNGLVHYGGRFHLFFQHNPFGCQWGNMHWGHAVSHDLLHWQELGEALYPDHLGAAFSGSAVVDWENRSGLGRAGGPPLVCMYTSAGKPFVQSLFYSDDGGDTWRTFDGNPVMGHIAAENRDPKVIWHPESGRWVMALYLDGARYALYNSADLKDWRHLCDVELPGAWECPDFFPLPADGAADDVRWVFWGANGSYLVGRFDGVTFEPEGELQRYDWSELTYAAQTWSDLPAGDGRRIQIAWARLAMPGMPFSQMMALPTELSLRRTPAGLRLYSRPIRELAALRQPRLAHTAWTAAAGETLLHDGDELVEVQVEFEVGAARSFGLVVRGVRIVYDVAAATLTAAGVAAAAEPEDGRIRLQVLADRAMVEVFVNDGAAALYLPVIPDPADLAVRVFAEGAPVTLARVDVAALASIWPEQA